MEKSLVPPPKSPTRTTALEVSFRAKKKAAAIGSKAKRISLKPSLAKAGWYRARARAVSGLAPANSTGRPTMAVIGSPAERPRRAGQDGRLNGARHAPE